MTARRGKPEQLVIDDTNLNAHRTAARLLKSDIPRRIGRTKGGLNSKLHAVCDDQGRPIMRVRAFCVKHLYTGADWQTPLHLRSLQYPRPRCPNDEEWNSAPQHATQFTTILSSG